MSGYIESETGQDVFFASDIKLGPEGLFMVEAAYSTDDGRILASRVTCPCMGLCYYTDNGYQPLPNDTEGWCYLSTGGVIRTSLTKGECEELEGAFRQTYPP